MKKILFVAVTLCAALTALTQGTAKADPSVGPPQFYRNAQLANGSLMPHTAYTLKVNVKNLINSETVPPGGFTVVIKLGTGLLFSGDLATLSPNYIWTADGTSDPTQVILRGALKSSVDMFYNEDLQIPVTTVNSIINQNYLLSSIQINGAVIKGNNFTLNDEAGSLYNVSSVTLPVLFTGFSVNASADCSAKASWQVGTETAVKGYYVEQSTDGVNYKPVAFVAAANKRSYEAAVPSSASGINFFRIKQEDLNGAFTYSNVEQVVICRGVRTEWQLTTYPNPIVTEDFIKVKNLNGSFLKKVRAQIVAIDGKVLLSKLVDARQVNQFDLSVKGIPQGAYLLTLSSEDNTQQPQSFKVTVLK